MDRVATLAAAVAGLLGAQLAGCLGPTRYRCADDGQCRLDGRIGECMDTGWCAYTDDSCESKLRYSGLADAPFANACVPYDPSAGSSSETSTGTSTSTTEASSSSSSTDSSSSTTAADCESTCIPGPHATAMCDRNGECIVTCDPPWENCDGDVATGCEVPAGAPHQCSARGLDPVEGCWTAWCGTSDDPAAVNFGTFYCIDCITCIEPSVGQCRWCEHETGLFYPEGTCTCGEYLGAACGP